MTLSVDVLPTEPLPRVRIVVDLPNGASWRVTGRLADGHGDQWLAGEGRSLGRETTFSDPWAPLGAPVVYELTPEWGPPAVSDPVVRTYNGEHVITNLNGRTAAEFRWTPGDPWDMDPRESSLDVWGSALPVAMDAPVAGAGGGAIAAKTVGVHTRTLTGLIKANRTVLLLHNLRACQMPDCDVPLVRTVKFTGVSADRSGRTDVAERIWDLTYRHRPRPYRYLPPVATWADVLERWATGADLLAEGMTNLDLARGDWLVGW